MYKICLNILSKYNIMYGRSILSIKGKTEDISEMKQRKIATGIFAMAGICLAMSSTCLAGSMNGNEASIYSAASGTFDYQGVTYKAAPQYLQQLQEYLCRDDIDLTADEANSAIAEMYASVEQGVMEGYILPIDGSAPNVPGGTTPGATNPGSAPGGTTNSGSTSPGTTNGNGSTGQTGNAGTAGTTTQPGSTNATAPQQSQSTDINKTADGDTVVTSNGMNVGGVSEEEQKKMEETLSTRTSEEEAKAQVKYNDEEDTVEFKTLEGKTYKLPEDVRDLGLGSWLNALKIIGIVLCVLSVLSGVVLFATGSMKFQKNKPENSSHKMRSTTRKVVGAVLALVLAADVLCASGSLWVRMSYFDSNQILESLSDSGYYHSAYNSMMSQVHTLMRFSGCEETICDNILTYEDFMFSTKNHMKLELQGKTSSATYEEVKTQVEEVLGGVEGMSDIKKSSAGSAVLVFYQSAVRNVMGDVAYGIKEIIKTDLGAIDIWMVISAVISIFLLAFSERYPHRGIRRMANACLLAGAVVAIACAWIGMGKGYQSFYITPDYLYLFVVYLIQSSVKVLGVIAGVIIAIGAALHLTAFGMRKRLTKFE